MFTGFDFADFDGWRTVQPNQLSRVTTSESVPGILHIILLFRGILGSVHTNPFSNGNGAVLHRIRLSSTLQRRKRSPKTEPFENALQSGAI